MEVWEKINYLLEEKKISKQEFANRLISLEPKLKRTLETPSSQTILGYLYGKRELKVELIPYIAEVLGVSEQELFNFNIEYATEYNYKQSKEVREIVDLLPYAPNSVVEHIKAQLQKYKNLNDETKNKI
ncbi:helix-turn-helix domain-containing protein [Aliarcobacter cryaerophilus]|jgi:transcriptional regulator with XRE-family HTH domain|uniref:helix-turn-helix domain-containing protein n=1 Tax=Aliarcobacter cryaerophilus TaxID=28198 RepID=UPI0021B5662F|nr:helix-turn-helix transcriptional regulator [Aliarcobacter cryaerophilus]MCT7472465.1 helix-turn-helix domain-containing protein [Aliarcobacter cryaerophilus]